MTLDLLFWIYYLISAVTMILLVSVEPIEENLKHQLIDMVLIVFAPVMLPALLLGAWIEQLRLRRLHE